MENQPKIVSFSLGSNLGNKEQNITSALEKISENIGEIISVSDYWNTEPIGFFSQNNFINCCCLVSTFLSIEDLLRHTQKIELEIGRRKLKVSGEYEDRIIDIDIIFYEDEIINTHKVTIPHKKFRKRDFVIIPLMQLSNQVDPETFISVNQYNK